MRSMWAGAATAMTSLTVLALAPAVSAAAAPVPGDAATVSAVGPAGVVVNELAPSGRFDDPTDEFLELHNTSDQVITLDEWGLWVCMPPDFPALLVVFGVDDFILPGDYYLLTHHSYAGSRSPDRTYGVDVPEDGGWLLHDPWSGYADGVGLRSGLACTEGSPAPQCEWAEGEGATRDEAGEDTDDNAADFTCQARTPGR